MSRIAYLTFLGTGTSQGVPIIGCNCKVCKSSEQKNKRYRTSALIKCEGSTIVIDAGPDFREQLLKADISNLDAILLTHPHRDHIGGLDDVRPFNYYQQRPMPIYGNSLTLSEVKKYLPYAFTKNPYPGAPKFSLNEVRANEAPFTVGNIPIMPIEIMHYKMPICGFRMGELTYITDANFISPKSMEIIKGSKIIVVNALRKLPHISHFNLEQALDFIRIAEPEKAYFTHISHDLDHNETMAELKDMKSNTSVELAYDGLTISFQI